MNEVPLNSDMIRRILAESKFAIFISTYRILVGAILAVTILTCIAALIISITKLGSTASHPLVRRSILINILEAGISLMLATGFSVIYVVILQLTVGPVTGG